MKMNDTEQDDTVIQPSPTRVFYEKCVSGLSSVFVWECPTHPTLVGHFNKNAW